MIAIYTPMVWHGMVPSIGAKLIMRKTNEIGRQRGESKKKKKNGNSDSDTQSPFGCQPGRPCLIPKVTALGCFFSVRQMCVEYGSRLRFKWFDFLFSTTD